MGNSTSSKTVVARKTPAPAAAPVAPAAPAAPAAAATVPELGTTRFLENVDQALAASASSGKPVFLLFQEVPGCSTCTNFGRDVLSNNSLVDLIHGAFVPCVVNNRGTRASDAEALARFREPALNNPVVRFLDSSGNDLVPRQTGLYTPLPILQRMLAALRAANPAYRAPAFAELMEQTLALEAGGERRRFESATFTMACYWTGERVLGALAGVARTTPGWLRGHEVVRVQVDTSKTSLVEVARVAKAAGFGGMPHSGAQALAMREAGIAIAARLQGPEALRAVGKSEEKHFLRHSQLGRLRDLCPAQQAKVNAAIAARRDASSFLAPWQLAEAAAFGLDIHNL